MSGFVLDAPVTLPWRFEDEATPWTEALLTRIESGEQAAVPAHWPLEVVNALLFAHRRGRAAGIAWENHRPTACDAARLDLVLRTGAHSLHLTTTCE
jgi:hypothetical protein